MCPEKERLMREFQRQVTHFEAIINSDGSPSISHQRAIKEYSRSSADQEIPLSHELRPERVLHMTMQYLLHEIADLCNDPNTSLADWYHFVWDRTRSIRKDITQQELCSAEAVQLVEQCARFHIHCAARLVAEDYVVFDKKINVENLTKCLQTLKYMYHDLRLKQVHCPCEAEFRSYIVLLNLGNANFLWELKHLPQHIQNAPQIKRAIAFYNALQHNNYVRFFALVRASDTTYLSACILLGYFSKLRYNALNVINKSYNWRKFDVYLPIEYFVQILGFEHTQAAVNFLQYHGMQCNEERVMLSQPQPQDIEYSMERALQLVESKRQVSVGECISGQPLESRELYFQHQPHNSFDENGLLKQEAWSANDQSDNAVKSVLPVFDKAVAKPAENIFSKFKSQAQPAAPAFSFGSFLRNNNKVEEKPKSTHIQLEEQPKSTNFQGNIFGFAQPIQTTQASQPISGMSLFAKPFGQNTASQSFAGNIFQTVKSSAVAENALHPPAATTEVELEELSDDMESVVEEVSLEKELEEEEFSEVEQQDTSDYARFNAQDIENEVALEDQAEVAALQRKEAETAKLQAQLRSELEQHARTLYVVLLNSVVEQIVQDEYEACLAVNELCQQKAAQIFNQSLVLIVKQIALEELQQLAHKCSLLRRTFVTWRNNARSRAQKRQILHSLPVFASTETREEQAAKVYVPNAEDTMFMRKRYRYGIACDFTKLLWDEKHNWQCHTNIFTLLYKQLPSISCTGQLRLRKYFKLLITLPAEQEELMGLKSYAELLLEQVFSTACAATAANSASYVCALQQNVALCVRKIVGSQVLNEQGKAALQDECAHADAVICIMSSAYTAQARLRLQQLFKRARNFKKLPMALFLLHESPHYTAADVMETLDIRNLRFKTQLSAVKCFAAGEHMQQQFVSALKFVARNVQVEDTQLLELQRLSSWLDVGIGAELWQRWQQSCEENVAFQVACSNPMHLVRLYNTALQRLLEIVEEHLEDYAEFPHELQEFVPKLQESSDMPVSLEHFPANWKQLYQQKKICQLLTNFSLPESAAPSSSDLEDVNALGTWCLNYAFSCLSTDEELVLNKADEQIRKFLLQCNLKQLNFLNFIRDLAHLRALLILSQERVLPQFVIYAREVMAQYLQLPWWLNCAPVTDIDLSNYYEEQSVADVADCAAEYSTQMHSVIEEAEQLVERLEQSKTNANNSTLDAVPNEVSLVLNQTLHNFEVTKLLGAYKLPTKSKRACTEEHEFGVTAKRACDNHNNIHSEIDGVIAKALAIIDKFENS